MKRINLLLICTTLVTFFSTAQENTPITELSEIAKKIYLTKRIIGAAPTIDGRLEDAAW